MSRRNKKRVLEHQLSTTEAAAPRPDLAQRLEQFSFGEPTPVMDGRDLMDYIECWQNGKYFEPPVSFEGLAKSFRSSVHHSSAIYMKRNALVGTFIPSKSLSRAAFSRWALDYLIFGNGYLEKRTSRTGLTLQLEPSLAKYTRRGSDLVSYFFVRGWQQEHQFAPGSIFHLIDPDIHQEIYGLPEYLSALQAAWLNESATLFRRKYYLNGSHAGFILYLTDATVDKDDVDKLREALRNSKGPGNFRNLFMHAPGGKKDGIQILPVSEIAAKDEFFSIKNVTRDDLLAAHRVPPQLLGVVPSNTGGFGDVERAAKVFGVNELMPLQERFLELNEWLGEEVIKFGQYELSTAQGEQQ